MATKTITITEDAYHALANHKKTGESFSELIRRSFARKGDVWQFAGAWKHLSEKTIARMKEDIERVNASSAKQLRRKLKQRT
jgi:predicted CopG family antitoxin